MQQLQCEMLEHSEIPLASFQTKTEKEICDFYAMILKQMYMISDRRFSKLRNSLKNIRSYKNPDVEKHEPVSFKEKSDRLAYIFAYGVIHSIVMYDRFSCMLKSNGSIVKRMQSMKQINLCILGGGPAFEVVSICKLLSNILTIRKEVGSLPLEVNLTVIDMCIGWREDAEFIINSAQNNLCDPNNVQIHFNFIEADLKAYLPDDVTKALRQSHFVTVFKVFTDFDDCSYSVTEIPAILEQIVESMSFKACLFFLDTSGGGFFNKMNREINELPHTVRIYGPHLYDCHALSIDSFLNFSEALSPIFRFLQCTYKSTFSCSAWIKLRNKVKVMSDNPKPTPTETACSFDASSGAVEDGFKDKKLKEKKRKNKIKIKKVYQSPLKVKELVESCSENDSNDSD